MPESNIKDQEQPRAVIADDDPFARRVIKDVLQRAGVIVIAEALSLIHI